MCCSNCIDSAHVQNIGTSDDLLSTCTRRRNEVKMKKLQETVDEMGEYLGQIRADTNRSLRKVRRNVEKFEDDVQDVATLVIKSLQHQNKQLRKKLHDNNNNINYNSNKNNNSNDNNDNDNQWKHDQQQELQLKQYQFLCEQHQQKQQHEKLNTQKLQTLETGNRRSDEQPSICHHPAIHQGIPELENLLAQNKMSLAHLDNIRNAYEEVWSREFCVESRTLGGDGLLRPPTRSGGCGVECGGGGMGASPRSYTSSFRTQSISLIASTWTHSTSTL